MGLPPNNGPFGGSKAVRNKRNRFKEKGKRAFRLRLPREIRPGPGSKQKDGGSKTRNRVGLPRTNGLLVGSKQKEPVQNNWKTSVSLETSSKNTIRTWFETTGRRFKNAKPRGTSSPKQPSCRFESDSKQQEQVQNNWKTSVSLETSFKHTIRT